MTDNQSSEVVRGSNGVVGKGTPGSHVKNLHRKFKETTKSHVHLKTFTRDLLKNGSPEEKKLVADWVECKNGALDASRSDENIAAAATCRDATKQSRHKGKK